MFKEGRLEGTGFHNNRFGRLGTGGTAGSDEGIDVWGKHYDCDAVDSK